MLEKINGDSDSVFIYKNTPDGMVELTHFQAYRMANNEVLVAMFDDAKMVTDYEYIAVSGEIEEGFCTQLFERVANIYNKPPTNDDGVFVFVNSLPVVLDNQTFRCDMTRFGPTRFTEDGSYGEPMTKGLEQIITYEPILSINGVGHIIFMHERDDIETADKVVNDFEIPAATRTLSELLKLMTEWVQTTEPPFNGTDPIAVHAKNFLEAIGMDETLIEHIKANQVDMQVVNYFSGSETARVRPDNVMPLTAEVESWLLPKFSFMTLSKLLEFYPDAWDADELLNKEKEVFVTRTSNAFSRYGMEYHSDSLDDIEYCVNLAVVNTGSEDARGFFTSVFNLLKFKRDTLNSL
jgi:hypothetical protein